MQSRDCFYTWDLLGIKFLLGYQCANDFRQLKFFFKKAMLFAQASLAA